MADPPLDRIHIRDLNTRCLIGTYDAERGEKQDVGINICLHVDLRQACGTDDLADTVDYKAIEERVIAMVADSTFFLLERLAERIAEICLSEALVRRVQVRVAKPGALRLARTVEIEIVRRRAQA